MALLVALSALPVAAQSLDEAWKRCENNDPDISIRGCTAVIEHKDETDARRAIAYAHRGGAWGTKREYDRAIESFDQAIRLAPSFAGGYVGRALTYEFKGQFDRAIEDYNQAIRLDPTDDSLVGERARAYLRAGRFDPAIADYDAVLRRNPRDPFALYGRGLAHRHKGDAARAAADIAAAKAISRDIAEDMERHFGLR